MKRTRFKLIAVAFGAVAMLSACADAGEPNAESPVSVSISDPDSNVSIKATAVVRNVKPVEILDTYTGKEETIAVKIEASVGDQYVTSFSGNALRIVTEDGADEFRALSERFPGRQADITAAQTAANRPPLALVERGQSGSGWVYFNIEPKGAKTLTLRYVRQQTTVVSPSGSQRLLAKDFDVVLQSKAAGS